MVGVRVADGEIGRNPFRPGAYGRVLVDGEWEWRGTTPNGHFGNLSAHEVTEHEDGTITVDPSIAVSDGERELWHGYLRAGVWSAC